MNAIKPKAITKVGTNDKKISEDFLAVEEPLEVRIAFGAIKNRERVRLTITMRTPINDGDLIIGLLYTEGIIDSLNDILEVKVVPSKNQLSQGNIFQIELSPGVEYEKEKFQRNFYTTSSCGMCGKSSIEAVQFSCNKELPENLPKISKDVLFNLPTFLGNNQTLFSKTGGLHAAGLFDKKGNLILIREDIGRHNAVDKLIGAAIKMDIFPLSNYLILVSGRAGFELVQKSIMAGIPVMAAVGAPSSLAVELAKESGMTLIGFLKSHKMNVYTFPERIY